MPIATGLFNVPAAPGAQSIVGMGFQPVGLKLFCVGNTIDETWSDPIRFGYGFTDGTNSFSCCAAMDDNVTPADAYTRAAVKVLTIIDGTGAVLAECDLTSFDADGATFDWTVAAGTQFLVGYIAFGGAGVQTYVQEWLTTAPNGNKSFNASGFTPQVVEFISVWTGGLAAPQSTTKSRISVGAMDYNGNQWCHNWRSEDAGAATNNARDTRDDSVVSQIDGFLGAITLSAAFVSMDAAGYTVNVTRSFDYAVYSFEVTGLDDVAVGHFVPPVGVGLQTTVVGFQPNGIFNVGSGPSLVSPRLEDIYTSIGACGAIGTDIGGVMSEPDNNNPSQQKVNLGSVKSFNKAKNVTETWNQRAHVNAYPVNGFQLSWTTVDGTANPNRFYIAYAAPVSIRPAIPHWDPPLGPTTPTHRQSRALTISIWKPDIAWTSGTPNSVVWTPEGLYQGDIRGDVEMYKHVLRALGGYWEATFRVNSSKDEAEDWLAERLGWHVEVHDEAGLTIFEGFVNSIEAVMGGFSVTRGPLLQVGNKATLVYSTVDTTTTPPTVGIRATVGPSEDDGQQQRYGILEKMLSAGGLAPAEAAQVLADWLAQNAQPRTTKRWSNAASSRTAFTVQVLGYVHLAQYLYSYVAATGTENLETKLARVLDQDPNALLSSANATITVTGASIAVRRYDDDQRTAWAIIKDLVARGDAEYDRYVFGVWANRHARYEQAPDDLDYYVRMTDPAQRVETPIGAEVYPWDVLPGKWALFADFLVDRVPPATDPRSDPRALFIEQATYTAPWGLALQGGRADRIDQRLAQLGLSGIGA